MAKKPPERDETAGTAVSGVRVVGPLQGRWRAGRWFGPAPVDIPGVELTPGEIAALQADPLLQVAIVEPSGKPGI